MFEDSPPPLPSASASSSPSPSPSANVDALAADLTIADLTDDSRLTAVADDDDEEEEEEEEDLQAAIDEEHSNIKPPPIPDFDPTTIFTSQIPPHSSTTANGIIKTSPAAPSGGGGVNELQNETEQKIENQSSTPHHHHHHHPLIQSNCSPLKSSNQHITTTSIDDVNCVQKRPLEGDHRQQVNDDNHQQVSSCAKQKQSDASSSYNHQHQHKSSDVHTDDDDDDGDQEVMIEANQLQQEEILPENEPQPEPEPGHEHEHDHLCEPSKTDSTLDEIIASKRDSFEEVQNGSEQVRKICDQATSSSSSSSIVKASITNSSSSQSSFLEHTDDAHTAISGRTFEKHIGSARQQDDAEDVNEDVNVDEEDDEDDDFGDFEEFGDFVETQSAMHVANEVVQSNKIADGQRSSSDDGWAAFETAAAAPPQIDTQANVNGNASSNDDEWAANFENASQQAQQQQLQSSGDTVKLTLSSLNELYEKDSLWIPENVEWEDSNEEDEASQTCNGELGEEEGVIENLDSTKETAIESAKPWQSLWLAISVVEEALALKMQWSDSSFHSNFLESLNLDANLATVRNSDLPAFAQHLDERAILQPLTSTTSNVSDPVKPERVQRVPPSLCKSKSNDSESSLHLETTQRSAHSIAHAPASVVVATAAAAAAAAAQRSRSVPVDSLAVPPAQFDWRNSGLTNPLTAGSISSSSALLDLDFLTANESRIVTIAGRSSTTADISAALQKDLAALGLNASLEQTNNHKDATSTHNCDNKANILEELMRKGKRERKYTRPNELSLDARALHDRLPDLDYMLANVLLFPMANR